MQNLDLIEKLKNVPKGTTLYSTIHGNLYFDCVDYYDDCHPIKCHRHGNEFSFTKEGKWHISYDGECVLFPSKEQRDWSEFDLPCQFKVGDVIYHELLNLISIYKGYNSRFPIIYDIDYKISNINDFKFDVHIDESSYRLATLGEKELFYNKLQEAGYFWNSLTNSLEKYKFNIGDKIQDKVTKQIYSICNIEQGIYKVKENPLCYLSANYQNDYELYQKKFDITTLKPYDKVLVRFNDTSIWEPQLFSCLDINLKHYANKFVLIGFCSKPQCIPYEGNEHLTGTTNNCDEYYKNW